MSGCVKGQTELEHLRGHLVGPQKRRHLSPHKFLAYMYPGRTKRTVNKDPH